MDKVKYIDDAERVLVSASTSVGARKFWYCTGDSLDNLEVKYGGKFLDEEEGFLPPELPKGKEPKYSLETRGAYEEYWQKRYEYEEYQKTEAAYKTAEPQYKRHQRQVNVLFDINNPDDEDNYEPPPSAKEIREMVERGELLVVEVKDLNGDIKGYTLLQRPLLREFEEKELPFNETERPIAEHLITMGARFLDPQEKPHIGSVEDRIDQLSNLQHLMMARLKEISPGTASHVERVGKLVINLIQEIITDKNFPIKLEMTKEDQDTLLLGYLYAVLHDFDKTQVPLSILHDTTGNLRADPRKWERMMLHAFNTFDVLNHPFLQEGNPKNPNASPASATAAHHMRPNYTGYPNSPDEDPYSPFVGEDGKLLPIPLFTRLIQLIDGYEAMSAKKNAARAYQKDKFSIDVDDGNGGTVRKTNMSTVLELLFFDAINDNVDPVLFRAFINSHTLIDDIRENQHMHLDPVSFKTIRMPDSSAQLDAACMQALAKQYTTVFVDIREEGIEKHRPNSTRSNGGKRTRL